MTKESQINRCLSNKHAWERISQTTSQQKVTDTQSVNGDREPSSSTSLHDPNTNKPKWETSHETIPQTIGDGLYVDGSRLDRVSANGISMEHYTDDKNSDVRQNNIDKNEVDNVVIAGKAHVEDGPSTVKRQRVEKVVVNGHQFSLENVETKSVDLNCNHNSSLKTETVLIVNDDVSDDHLCKQTVIHAFPSISHCIEWIVQGKQLRDDSTQGKPLGESVEPVLYDANQGDLEDFDKSLPDIGDKHVNILVTGSLHLVGGALRVIDAENVCS